VARDRVAVLLHVGLDAIVHLRGRVGELAREREQHADLDRLLRLCGERNDERCGRDESKHVPSS
jgi:hypothetical protein